MSKSMAAFVSFLGTQLQKEFVMSLQENKEVYRHVLNELYNHGNLDVVDEYIAADFVYHVSMPGISPDREGAKQFVRGITAAFSDIRYTVEDVLAEGDKVVARWSSRGVQTGELMGVPATGKEVATTGISIARVVDGKIKEVWSEFDALGMLQQLGAMDAPAAGS